MGERYVVTVWEGRYGLSQGEVTRTDDLVEALRAAAKAGCSWQTLADRETGEITFCMVNGEMPELYAEMVEAVDVSGRSGCSCHPVRVSNGIIFRMKGVTMNIVRLIEGFSREVAIPEGYEGAEIYNAPRPFPATVTWQGEFICGVFYGAIDPENEFADENRERARQLDATRLVFVSRAEVEEWGREYCKEYDVVYEDFEWSDIVKAYLRNHAEEV